MDCESKANARYAKANGKEAYNKRQLLANRKHRYGVTQKDFEYMLHQQEFRCAICSKEIDEKANVDHDHDTLEVRGLLCSRCNKVLGLVNESREILQAMIDYLPASSREQKGYSDAT